MHTHTHTHNHYMVLVMASTISKQKIALVFGSYKYLGVEFREGWRSKCNCIAHTRKVRCHFARMISHSLVSYFSNEFHAFCSFFVRNYWLQSDKNWHFNELFGQAQVKMNWNRIMFSWITFEPLWNHIEQTNSFFDLRVATILVAVVWPCKRVSVRAFFLFQRVK